MVLCKVGQGFDESIYVRWLRIDVAGSARGGGDAHAFEQRQSRKIAAADGDSALVEGVNDMRNGRIFTPTAPTWRRRRQVRTRMLEGLAGS